MVPHFMSAFWRTVKSGFGLLGLAITGLGFIGHNLEATRVNVWVCVVGLSLFSLAALLELSKASASVQTESGRVTEASEKAWHYEKERDHYRRLLDERQEAWISGQGQATSGSTGPVGGDVNQRAFLFADPHQLILPPVRKGLHRFQGFEPDEDNSGGDG